MRHVNHKEVEELPTKLGVLVHGHCKTIHNVRFGVLLFFIFYLLGERVNAGGESGLEIGDNLVSETDPDAEFAEAGKGVQEPESVARRAPARHIDQLLQQALEELLLVIISGNIRPDPQQDLFQGAAHLAVQGPVQLDALEGDDNAVPPLSVKEVLGRRHFTLEVVAYELEIDIIAFVPVLPGHGKSVEVLQNFDDTLLDFLGVNVLGVVEN